MIGERPLPSRWDDLRATMAIVRAQFANSFATELQYRTSTLIWMISGILEPILYLMVWSAVALSQGGAVNGLTPADFAAYYIAVFFVGEATYSWNTWLYDDYIRNGTLAAGLVRPAHPIWFDIARNLGNKCTRMVIVVVATVVMLLLFRPQMSGSLWSWALFVLSLLLASALYFALDFLASLTAFWTTSTAAIGRSFDSFFILLSGYVAPLQLFPPAVQMLTWLLPFRWVLAFPVDLWLGALAPREALTGILMQMGWLAACCALIPFVWRRAVRRFSAVGG